MTLDVGHLRALRSRNTPVRYGERDTVLYALALGLGQDPRAVGEAAYVVPSPALRALPTLATELASAGFLDGCGWQADAVRHVRESVRLHRPLDESGAWLIDGDVTAVFDLGSAAGALVDVELKIRRQRDNEPVGTVQRRYLAGADGGFGGPRPPDSGGALPGRPPDLTETATPGAAQALWYAVSRPDAAARGAMAPGASRALAYPTELPAPAVFGLAGLAVLRVICEFDHTLVTSLAADLGGPARAGEALVTEFWQDANVVRFRVRAPARDVTLVDRGTCVLAT